MILKPWCFGPTNELSGELGGYLFWCPGCEELHQVWTHPKLPANQRWEFNGDLVKPTFKPSILLTRPPTDYRCHTWIADGQILFCGDSNHKLSGYCVNMVDIPDQYTR